ncbi:hypothetical protein [Oceanispirochaeta sp.]|jgi:hypothetical protein|uniref:hypothetical protein n=1 Tax=Oceanispirochaeta sp. TaxID=2035350 RepID=UPI00262F589B|nr:hypothetical protein [Oceanispirochaeta sp.]MDA3957529.1 hypothetical protein [Oceanispirochaeta sp.]
MKRKDLILNLIGEISNYLLDDDPMRLVVSLHQEKDGLHLCILDDNKHNEEELDSMRKALNSRKRPELAGYYGAMTGHDMLGSARLDLLGWQVKHCDVVQSDSGIKIDLWFGGEDFQSDQFTIPVRK